MNDQPLVCRVCADSGIRVVDRIETRNCDEPVPACHCRNCGHYSLFPIQYQRQKAFEWDGVDYYARDLDARRGACRQVIERMRKVYRAANGKEPQSFLDAGCALGWSLSLAESMGMKAVGIEPESRLAEYGRQEFGVDIRHGKLADPGLIEQTFDLVYCEQVLEHIEAPRQFLGHLKQRLASGGRLYIGVPPVFPLNRLSTFMIRKMQMPLPSTVMSNIFHDPDEHISAFSRRSLRYLAAGADMHIKPLPLTTRTLSFRRLAKRFLTMGANSGNWILYRHQQS